MDVIENGKRLRKLRGDRSPNMVSNAVGISESALLMYERGERNPRDDIKIALADYYGVDIRALFYPEYLTKCEDVG